LASATASLRAFCASTPLKIADSTAFATIALTSAFLGIVGMMFFSLLMMSFARGRALSSMAAGASVKNGSSNAASVEG
jgi:hypothetical protein